MGVLYLRLSTNLRGFTNPTAIDTSILKLTLLVHSPDEYRDYSGMEWNTTEVSANTVKI